MKFLYFLLFALVNVGRFLKIAPEDTLRRVVEKLERRFRQVEETARAQGRDVQKILVQEMDQIWDQNKKRCYVILFKQQHVSRLHQGTGLGKVRWTVLMHAVSKEVV